MKHNPIRGTYNRRPGSDGPNRGGFRINDLFGQPPADAGPRASVSLPDYTFEYGQTVAVTATVTGNAGTPTGKITFSSTGLSIAGDTVALTAGAAAKSYTTDFNVGSYDMTAAYGGDGTYAAKSDSATITVNKATTAVTFNAATFDYGQGVTLPCTVSTSNGVTPSGTVSITLGGHSTATATLSGGTASKSFGTTIPVGSYPASVVDYAGASNFATASSASRTITVSKAATTATINSLTRSSQQYGQFTSVAVAGNLATAYENVSGATLSYLLDAVQQTTASTNASGNATGTISGIDTLGVGTHTIGLGYAGGTSYNAATTATSSYTVSQATPSFSAGLWTNTSYNVAYSASITAGDTTLAYPRCVLTNPHNAAAVASVSVVFKVDGTGVETVTTNGSGVAAFSAYNPSALAAGVHTITFSFAGNTNYASATSSSISLTVNSGTPTIALVSGQSAETTGTSGTLSGTWPTATTAGNLLVAHYACTTTDSAQPSVPSGWNVDAWNAPNLMGTYTHSLIASKPNAASQSTTGNFGANMTGATRSHLEIMEYEGITPYDPKDQSAVTTNSSTSLTFGPTMSTLSAASLVIAGASQNQANTFSSPGSSFSIVNQDSQSTGSAAVMQKIVSSSGSQSTTLTSSGVGDVWSGTIATYRGIPPTTGLRLIQHASGGGNGGAITVNWPTAVTAGTLMNALVTWVGADSTEPTLPSGWTRNGTVSTYSFMSIVRNVAQYYKVATGGETSATFTFGSTYDRSVILSEWGGLNASNPRNNRADNESGETSTMTFDDGTFPDGSTGITLAGFMWEFGAPNGYPSNLSLVRSQAGSAHTSALYAAYSPSLTSTSISMSSITTWVCNERSYKT